MLNELHQISQALERVGIAPPKRHPRISPMRRTSELLIIRMSEESKPSDVEFVPGTVAAQLFRVEHGSAGSSFPGFNIPTPLLDLTQASTDLKPVLQRLCDLLKKKDSSTNQIHGTVIELAALSQPRQFTPNQSRQFSRSVVDLVQELQGKFCKAEPELASFKRLLDIVGCAELDLDQFSQNLTDTLLSTVRTADRDTLSLIQGVLLGMLDWKKRTADFGSANYWGEKAKKDKNANRPVYLDVANMDHKHKPVAHSDTSEAINAMLFQQDRENSMEATQADHGVVDAFGSRGPLRTKYPEPKIAKLGNVRLFSVNTRETPALTRYGLKGSKQFPASAQIVQKMNDGLLYLGGEERKEGITWQPIPSAQPKKQDLLIAYLEEAPDFQEELADFFGGEAKNFGDADFAARTQPVLEALDGKLQTNPSLKVRLLALCSLDKGRKQISLHRQFRVQDIVRAAWDWKNGAANTPTVSIWFHNKKEKKTVWTLHFVPHPLDLTSVINRVWNSDPKSGFKSKFQRAVTTSDAYDVFFADGPISESKTRLCFSLLLYRMSPVLACLGGIKAGSNWKDLSEPVRWQCRKAVSLLGILLHQLEYLKDQFMEDSTYQIGRLLTLADSLHFQYCKWVRTSDGKRKKGEVDAPSELLGNSLFNFALDNPIVALARLAERIRPYKGWADTYDGEDAGLVHWFVRQMGECERHLDATELPLHMKDIHKAQLLLGYLADHSKTATED